MKTFFSLLVFSFLSVVGVCGQQIDVSEGLPIGVNVDNHPSKIEVYFGGANRQYLNIDYTPQMGNLGDIVETYLQEMANQFSPIVGLEQEQYGINVQVEPGPSISKTFVPQKTDFGWIVPPEALDVKLNYGAGVGWQINGVTVIEMDVVTASGVQHFSSENGGAGASPCYLGLLQDSLGRGGLTVVESRYAVSSLQEENGVFPGSTLTLREQNLYRYVTIDLMNGSVIDYSSPPPSFLTFPKPKLEIARTTDGWFEFLVSNAWDQSFVIESTTDFVTWEPYPIFRLKSVEKTQNKSFRPEKVTSGSKFFRLRMNSFSEQ
ncbi:MAG: hypothetical protein NUV47_01310 [Patescibacteria group bacterium]|nr:hypothetical protein [Patescibacteria group bacterium]